MKSFFIILVFATYFLNAQNKIKLSIDYFNLQPEIDENFNDIKINYDSIKNIYVWLFNDSLINYQKNNFINLKTNYPEFDKITMINKIKKDTFILYSLMKPNIKYTAQCEITYNYVSLFGNNGTKYPDNVKLNFEAYDSLFKKIELGTVQFNGRNIPKSINIVGIYGHNVGLSTGVKIENKLSDFKLLPFCAGLNPNATKQVIIGEYTKANNEILDSLYQKYNTVFYLINSNDMKFEEQIPIIIQNIKHKFYIRVFNNENVIIEYNYLTNKYKITSE